MVPRLTVTDRYLQKTADGASRGDASIEQSPAVLQGSAGKSQLQEPPYPSVI